MQANAMIKKFLNTMDIILFILFIFIILKLDNVYYLIYIYGSESFLYDMGLAHFAWMFFQEFVILTPDPFIIWNTGHEFSTFL